MGDKALPGSIWQIGTPEDGLLALILGGPREVRAGISEYKVVPLREARADHAVAASVEVVISSAATARSRQYVAEVDNTRSVPADSLTATVDLVTGESTAVIDEIRQVYRAVLSGSVARERQTTAQHDASVKLWKPITGHLYSTNSDSGDPYSKQDDACEARSGVFEDTPHAWGMFDARPDIHRVVFEESCLGSPRVWAVEQSTVRLNVQLVIDLTSVARTLLVFSGSSDAVCYKRNLGKISTLGLIERPRDGVSYGRSPNGAGAL